MKEALTLALEALKMNPLDTPTDVYDTKYQKAIDVAEEALAQPEQDQTEIAFEAWWQAHGQYCRAGGGDYEKTFAYRAWMASLAIPEKPEHPEQMARLGWQYVECPACGSEGARAFPKPEEEPVAWLRADGMKAMEADEKKSWIDSGNPELVAEYIIPLFTSPPQRQPLTNEERDSVLDSVPPDNMGGEYYDKEITAIAIAIEAKLKEKNT